MVPRTAEEYAFVAGAAMRWRLPWMMSDPPVPAPDPTHPPAPPEMPPRPVPIDVPSPVPDSVPPPNEPVGVPPTAPPEIPVSLATRLWARARHGVHPQRRPVTIPARSTSMFSRLGSRSVE
jgi:hypothetical protein